MRETTYSLDWRVTPGNYYYDERQYSRTLVKTIRWHWPRTPQGVRVYDPFRDCSGLFRTFAFTPPTKEGVLAFAEQYGLLGREQPFNSERFADPPVRMDIADYVGELLEEWQANIRTLRRLVRLWDFCQAGDMDGLRSKIHWGGFFDAFVVRYQEGPGREGDLDPECPAVDEMIASPNHHPEILARFKTHDVYGPAFAYIRQVVNKHLGAIQIHLEWNTDQGRLERKSSPKNLLDALWLQFAEAVNTGNVFRACRSCGIWFELTPEIARKSRVYCTTACRNRAYRDRQRQACEMNAEGKPLKEIAEELDTDVKTVKKWIKAATE